MQPSIIDTMVAASRSARSIGIVEDDDSFRIALQRLLRSAGYESCAFGSVEEFLESAPNAELACLLVDVRLPGRSGLELPGLLTQRGLLVPVIYLTAYDTLEARAEAKRAGAAGFFRKPVDDRALLGAIEWALAIANGPTPRKTGGPQ